jgi:hypothetical protein
MGSPDKQPENGFNQERELAHNFLFLVSNLFISPFLGFCFFTCGVMFGEADTSFAGGIQQTSESSRTRD